MRAMGPLVDLRSALQAYARRQREALVKFGPMPMFGLIPKVQPEPECGPWRGGSGNQRQRRAKRFGRQS